MSHAASYSYGDFVVGGQLKLSQPGSGLGVKGASSANPVSMIHYTPANPGASRGTGEMFAQGSVKLTAGANVTLSSGATDEIIIAATGGGSGGGGVTYLSADIGTAQPVGGNGPLGIKSAAGGVVTTLAVGTTDLFIDAPKAFTSVAGDTGTAEAVSHVFGVKGGNGISTVASAGKVTITNTGLAAVSAGTGISVSAVSGGSQTISALGVSAGTGIAVGSGGGGTQSISNTGLLAATAGTGISVSALSGGSQTIANTGVTALTTDTPTFTNLSGASGAVTTGVTRFVCGLLKGDTGTAAVAGEGLAGPNAFTITGGTGITTRSDTGTSTLTITNTGLTSVSGGTGIQVSVPANGVQSITNSGLLSVAAGTGISVTQPSNGVQTISAAPSSGVQSVTAAVGTSGLLVTRGATAQDVVLENTGVVSIQAGTNITPSGGSAVTLALQNVPAAIGDSSGVFKGGNVFNSLPQNAIQVTCGDYLSALYDGTVAIPKLVLQVARTPVTAIGAWTDNIPGTTVRTYGSGGGASANPYVPVLNTWTTAGTYTFQISDGSTASCEILLFLPKSSSAVRKGKVSIPQAMLASALPPYWLGFSIMSDPAGLSYFSEQTQWSSIQITPCNPSLNNLAQVDFGYNTHTPLGGYLPESAFVIRPTAVDQDFEFYYELST